MQHFAVMIESTAFQMAVGAMLGLTVIAGTIATGYVARVRHRAPIAVVIASASTFCFGLGIAGLAVAHIVGVVYTAGILRHYIWDFRFAGLMLVGLNLATAGVLCAAAAAGLGRAQRSAWTLAAAGTLWVLVVNALVWRIQPGFANFLLPMGAVNLVVLFVARLQVGSMVIRFHWAWLPAALVVALIAWQLYDTVATTILLVAGLTVALVLEWRARRHTVAART